MTVNSNKKSWADIVNSVQHKSINELQSEGKEAASTASANAAGEAKKQAKAAAVMGNASKLQAATQGAAAASDAATEGFQRASESATAQAAAQDNAQVAAQQNALIAQQQQEAQRKENEKNRQAQLAGSVIGAVGSAFSDASKKKFKRHTYIPAEARGDK